MKNEFTSKMKRLSVASFAKLSSSEKQSGRHISSHLVIISPSHVRVIVQIPFTIHGTSLLFQRIINGSFHIAFVLFIVLPLLRQDLQTPDVLQLREADGPLNSVVRVMV